MKKLLIIFAKFPLAGSVKTRLARSIGKQNAAFFYRCALAQIVEKFTHSSHAFDVQVAVAQENRVNVFRKLYPGASAYFAQTPHANLGGRMQTAISYGLMNRYDSVAVIGTDCPHLPVSTVQQAFERLHAHDVVIGPASDGGYYLLAVKNEHPCLFENIEWSTERVFGQTQHAATKAGLSMSLLPELYDIDVIDDLRRLLRDFPEFFERFETEYSTSAREISTLLRGEHSDSLF